MEAQGLAVIPLCFAAFCAAALSMDRHHRQVTGKACPARRRRRLRRISTLGLAAAAAIAVTGGGVGLVAGVLGAGLAAGAVASILNVRPQLLRRLVG